MTPLESLVLSPEAYPYNWDLPTGEVALVRLTEADYAAASFLDQRAVPQGTSGRKVGLDELRAAVAKAALKERLGFIFHIGHVGSTLLSRLLGATSGVLSLREPLPLRTLALLKADLDLPESYISSEDYERELTFFMKLWSRVFRPGQAAVVKATSFASECAAGIVVRPSSPSALLMYASPEAYIAGILAGPNSRVEARTTAQSKVKRLNRRLADRPLILHELAEGERIAAGWACEMTALAEAAKARPGQAAWLDFDRFLAGPEPLLAAAFARFGVEISTDEVTALASGPMMGQYAKAPEHPYDASLRAEVLDLGRAASGAELRQGLRWLERAAKAYPAIAETLDLANTHSRQ